ncbi:FAD-binding oxidoreductase [Pelodictyon luteolum]|uniref:D-lactate dehydrogenase (Cytochrome) n=1 Tax=Chlorobium luteolum (strain DSM 273 / BCRC 81028 / 2530) TaxID=319225 RepID=Q3B5C8_CHLL3|nr:FAD-binding oxidoreductase [Pelodictyon luteolum]ABB23453.1 D-lactate dehydrogenase (cytochrome) [Pelodictyon luteolum DSM 273]
MIHKQDPASIQSYLEDTSNLKTGHTEGVYIPETPEEISALLREAAALGRRYTISGNGTGTTGGRIPLGGHVISMEKLNAIGEPRQTEPGKAIMRVQAGAMLADVQKKAEAAGWFYPPDPTEKLCFIGSTIANNSSGARSFKYGATRRHIERITILLPEGDMLSLQRGEHRADAQGIFRLELPSGEHREFHRPRYRMPGTTKHNAGYYTAERMDLIDLFIGSEGTLALILEADLMLIPLPERLISAIIYFQELDGLMGFTGALRAIEGPRRPRALELFEKNALGFLRQKYPDTPGDTAGAVFLEQETTTGAEDEDLEALFSIVEEHGGMAEESWIALDREEQDRMREFRHSLPLLVNEWLSRQAESKVSTDMAVPFPRFRELFDFYRTACEQHGFVYIIFGHIGDGHVHLNILPRSHLEFIEAKALYLEFIAKVLELGGTLSAEHGIGKLKSGYLAAMYGEEGLREMAALKRTFDPFQVLNIGNIIPVEYLENRNK